MTVITPGIDFLAPSLVKLSIPPILLTLAANYFGANYIPTWLVVSASIINVPLVSATKIIWTSFSDKRAAAALGARLIPVVEGKLIGNFDVLKDLLRLSEFGYPGT
jgi:hypothetical protein